MMSYRGVRSTSADGCGKGHRDTVRQPTAACGARHDYGRHPRHMVRAAARRPDPSGMAALRAVRRRHRLRRGQRVAHPDRVGHRRRGRRADRAAVAGESVCRVRERHHSPHRTGLSGGALRREVRSRRADRSPPRQPLWPIDAGTVVQHLPRGRPHRAGLPEQHGAFRRHLSPRVLARRCRRREAGRRERAWGCCHSSCTGSSPPS